MFSKCIANRFDVIREHVQSGFVLDVGCVDARSSRERSSQRIERKPDALFRGITEINADTVGVDIDEEGVMVLREMGYSVIFDDAETMNLGRQFDVIVAGEVIEHLENPGLFLRNLRRHLKPDGTIILTTPNPFYAGQGWKIWRYQSPDVHEDHMGWQDPITLCQLLRRTKFDVLDGYWIQPRRKLLKTWKRLLRPYFSHSFLLVARPNPDSRVEQNDQLRLPAQDARHHIADELTPVNAETASPLMVAK